MAIPANVKTKLQSTSHGAHQVLMSELKGNIQSANNVIRHSSARQVDEPGPAQARSIDKILRTPGPYTPPPPLSAAQIAAGAHN